MSSSTSGPAGTGRAGTKHAAGAFDVRNVIAALIGFYGVVLVLLGLFSDTASDREKTGDVNANLWAGLAMLAFAAGFALWSRLRPIVVEAPPDRQDPEDDGGGTAGGGASLRKG
jgi:drug/metabolite transporter (DMT)-like permease